MPRNSMPKIDNSNVETYIVQLHYNFFGAISTHMKPLPNDN